MARIEEQPSCRFRYKSGMGRVPFFCDDTRLVLLNDLYIRCLVGLGVQGIQIPETSVLTIAKEMVADPVEWFLT